VVDWSFLTRLATLCLDPIVLTFAVGVDCVETNTFGAKRVRDELGFGAEDGDLDRMVRDQAYRGSRYSVGYPACPDLEDRAKLVELLKPERIGVHLSEELQLHPEQSTDALVVHHPEAKYLNAS
jgi:cobalamin-dependent methionine synthase I